MLDHLGLFDTIPYNWRACIVRIWMRFNLIFYILRTNTVYYGVNGIIIVFYICIVQLLGGISVNRDRSCNGRDRINKIRHNRGYKHHKVY